VVLCCAGVGWVERLIGPDGPHGSDTFARILAINVVGSFNVLRHAARVMATNEPDNQGLRGVCVLTSSIVAEDGQTGHVAYAASKAAVTGMTLPAARDLGPRGIRVCSIAPDRSRPP
jgi:NAD(P)-dependent dehydrogenase (short-subunit alcohol dehydrogenase family)